MAAAGADDYSGSRWADEFRGNGNSNTIAGNASDDHLEGLGGADHIRGGAGDDRLLGGAGADTLIGGIGDDTLAGGADHDKLSSGPGNDLLQGGVGNDRLALSEEKIVAEVTAVNGDVLTVNSLEGFPAPIPGNLPITIDGHATRIVDFTERLDQTSPTIEVPAGSGVTFNVNNSIVLHDNYLTTLRADFTNTATTMPVVSGSRLEAGWTVSLGDEWLYIKSTNDNDIEVVRGFYGTTPLAHDTNDVIRKINTDINVLQGEDGDDTYVPAGQWGTTLLEEQSGNGNDTLDLTRTSGPYTHVLSGRTLVSTPGTYSGGKIYQRQQYADIAVTLNSNDGSIQTISTEATRGEFVLDYLGKTTAPISAYASPTDVELALQALSSIHSVKVSGTMGHWVISDIVGTWPETRTGSLAVAIDDTATEFKVNDFTLLVPDPTAVPFNVYIGTEIMQVTAASQPDSTITVNRAQTGTQAHSHPETTKIYRLSPASRAKLRRDVNDSATEFHVSPVNEIQAGAFLGIADERLKVVDTPTTKERSFKATTIVDTTNHRIHLGPHVLKDGYTVTYRPEGASTPIAPLGSNPTEANFSVKVTGDQIELHTATGGGQNLSESTGTHAIHYSLKLRAQVVKTDTDSLVIPGHQLSVDNAVKYTTVNGLAIGGLTDGSDYWVHSVNGNSLKLKAKLADTDPVRLTGTGRGEHKLGNKGFFTGQFATNAALYIHDHGFADGDVVTYHGHREQQTSAPISLGNLKDSTRYEVKVVNANSIQLLSQTANPPVVGLDSIPAGEEHSLTVRYEILADPVIDTVNNRIRLVDHGLQDGDLVVYSTTGGNIGLTTGTTYKVKKVNDHQISLENPTTSGALQLSADESGNDHKLVGPDGIVRVNRGLNCQSTSTPCAVAHAQGDSIQTVSENPLPILPRPHPDNPLLKPGPLFQKAATLKQEIADTASKTVSFDNAPDANGISPRRKMPKTPFVIKIGSELMRVESYDTPVDTDPQRLTVTRGHEGSNAATHAANDALFVRQQRSVVQLERAQDDYKGTTLSWGAVRLAMLGFAPGQSGVGEFVEPDASGNKANAKLTATQAVYKTGKSNEALLSTHSTFPEGFDNIIRLRLLISFGGPAQTYEVSVDVGNSTSNNNLLQKVKDGLRLAGLQIATGTTPAAKEIAVSWSGSGIRNYLKLEVGHDGVSNRTLVDGTSTVVKRSPAWITVLPPANDTVVVGRNPGAMELSRIQDETAQLADADEIVERVKKGPSLEYLETIKTNKEDNYFLFGNDYWKSVPGTTFGKPVLCNPLPFTNCDKPNLTIDTSEITGELVLDFRAVSAPLEFSFGKETNAGGIQLEVTQSKEFQVPFYGIGYEYDGNSIEFSNVDERTVIYAGRHSNSFTFDEDPNSPNFAVFPGTVIGGGGRTVSRDPLAFANDMVEVLSSAAPAQELFRVQNSVSYPGQGAKFWKKGVDTRIGRSAAKGWSLCPGPLTNLPQGFSGTVKKIEHIELNSGRNTAFSGSYASPYSPVCTSFGSLPSGIMSGSDDGFGANHFTVGSGKFSFPQPGIHIMSGKDGPDRYTFDTGLWGLALIPESPDLTVAGVNVLDPFDGDTLDFDGSYSDLDFHILEVSTKQLWELIDSVAGNASDWSKGLRDLLTGAIDIRIQVVFVVPGGTGIDRLIDLFSPTRMTQDFDIDNDAVPDSDGDNQCEGAALFDNEDCEATGGVYDSIGAMMAEVVSHMPNFLIATDIENISGSRGVNTIHFHYGSSIEGVLAPGNGGKLILDYSNYRYDGDNTQTLGTGAYVDAGRIFLNVLPEDTFFGLPINSEYLSVPDATISYGRAEGVAGQRLPGVGGLIDKITAALDDGSGTPEFGLFREIGALEIGHKVTGSIRNDVIRGDADNNIIIGSDGFDVLDGHTDGMTIQGGFEVVKENEDVLSYAGNQLITSCNLVIDLNSGATASWEDSSDCHLGSTETTAPWINPVWRFTDTSDFKTNLARTLSDHGLTVDTTSDVVISFPITDGKQLCISSDDSKSCNLTGTDEVFSINNTETQTVRIPDDLGIGEKWTFTLRDDDPNTSDVTFEEAVTGTNNTASAFAAALAVKSASPYTLSAAGSNLSITNPTGSLTVTITRVGTNPSPITTSSETKTVAIPDDLGIGETWTFAISDGNTDISFEQTVSDLADTTTAFATALAAAGNAVSDSPYTLIAADSDLSITNPAGRLTVTITRSTTNATPTADSTETATFTVPSNLYSGEKWALTLSDGDAATDDISFEQTVSDLAQTTTEFAEALAVTGEAVLASPYTLIAADSDLSITNPSGSLTVTITRSSTNPSPSANSTISQTLTISDTLFHVQQIFVSFKNSDGTATDADPIAVGIPAELATLVSSAFQDAAIPSNGLLQINAANVKGNAYETLFLVHASTATPAIPAKESVDQLRTSYGANMQPVANNDVFRFAQATGTFELDVLQNDIDLEGDRLKILNVEAPIGCAAAVSPGDSAATPPTIDEISITVVSDDALSDGHGMCSFAYSIGDGLADDPAATDGRRARVVLLFAASTTNVPPQSFWNEASAARVNSADINKFDLIEDLEELAGGKGNDVIVGKAEQANRFFLHENWGHDLIIGHMEDDEENNDSISEVLPDALFDAKGSEDVTVVDIGKRNFRFYYTVSEESLTNSALTSKIAKYDPSRGGTLYKNKGFFNRKAGLALEAGPSEVPSEVDVAAIGPESMHTVDSSMNEAIQRWIEANPTHANPETFSNVNYTITDLPGSILGMADGYELYFDVDGAGTGWFLDSTPADDSEFIAVDDILAADPDGAAAGRYDFLTVATHELGHVLGLPDGTMDPRSLMYFQLLPGQRKSVPAIENWPENNTPVFGYTQGSTDTDRLVAGMRQFRDWASGFGTRIEESLANIELPFVDTSIDLSSIWDTGDNSMATGFANQIDTQLITPLDSAITAAPGDQVTSDDILSVTAISPSPNTNPREFKGTIRLADYRNEITMNFQSDVLAEFGLSDLGIVQSEPLILQGFIDLTFTFGLQDDGVFYVSDPEVTATVKVDHANPLDIAISLGPLGVAIDNAIAKFQVSLGMAVEGRLAFDPVGNITSSIGPMGLGGGGSWEVYIPVKLKGNVPGITDNTALISGSFNTTANPAPAMQNSLGGFFSSIKDNLQITGFDGLFSLQGVSLDTLLAGMSDVLDSLVEPDGMAFKNIPGVDQSIVGLLGGGENEQQTVTVSGTPSGGNFTLTYDPDIYTTATIAHDATALDIEKALERLPNLLDVIVTGTGATADPWLITFKSPGNQDVTQLAGDNISLGGASLTITTHTAGTDANNEIQQVSHNAASGTFALTFDLDTTNAEISDPIAVTTADGPLKASDLEAILEDSLPSMSDLVVTGPAGGPWTIDFVAPGQRNLTQFRSDDAAIHVTTTRDGGNLIQDLKSGIDTLRASLSNMQALERDLNFMLNDVLGLGRDMGNKEDLQSAYNRLVTTSPLLSGNSTDAEIAFTLAEKLAAFPQLQLDRDISAAAARLAAVGLTGKATNSDIVLALVASEQTDDLPFDISAGELQTNLNSLDSISAVTVTGTGTSADPWLVTFTKPDNVSTLLASETELTGSFSVTKVSDGSADTKEVQRIHHSGSGGGFILELGGQRTESLAVNSSAGDIKAALEALESLEEVLVTGLGSEESPWEVTILAPSAENLPTFRVDDHDVVISTAREGVAPVNETQLVTLNAVAGTFALALGTESTRDLPVSATAADVEAALEDLAAVSDVSISGNGSDDQPWRIEFLDPANVDVADLQGDETNLTDGELRITTLANGVAPVQEIQQISHNARGGVFKLTMDPDGFENLQRERNKLAAHPLLAASIGRLDRAGFNALSTDEEIETAFDTSTQVAEAMSNRNLVANWQAGGANEIQQIHHGATTGTFTLRLGEEETASLSYDALATTIESAVESFTAIVDATVSGQGTPSDPWRITIRDPAKTNIETISMQAGALMAGETHTETVVDGQAGLSEIQQVYTDATTGTFTLTYGENSTSPLAPNSSAADIEAALESLTGIHDTQVTGAGSESDPWLIAFLDPGGQDLVLLEGNKAGLGDAKLMVATVTDGNSAAFDQAERMLNLSGLSALSSDEDIQLAFDNITPRIDVVTVTEGTHTTNEIQQISNNAAAGTWTLQFGDSASNPISFDAAAQGTTDSIEAVLEAFPEVEDVEVTGAGTRASPWRIIFVSPGNIDVPAIQVDGSALLSERDRLLADRSRVLAAPLEVTTAASRLALRRLNSTSTDDEIATSLVDTALLQARMTDRDVLRNNGATTTDTVAEADARLLAQRLDTSASDDDIALALVGSKATDPLSFDANSTDISTALGLLLHFPGATVSGSGTVATPWTVTFDVPGNQQPLKVDESSLVGDYTVTTVSDGGPDGQEVQSISQSGAGREFVIEFGGRRTPSLPANSTAAELESALESLGTIGDVSVTGAGLTTDPWEVTFIDPAGSDLATLHVDDIVTTVTTTTEGVAAIDEVQTVALTADGGTFDLTFDGQTAISLAHNSAADALESALEALSNITDVNVLGSGTEATPWQITFLDPAGQDVPEVTVDVANLTGASVAATIATTNEGFAGVLEIQQISHDARAGDLRLVFDPYNIEGLKQDRDTLAYFETQKAATLAYQNSKFFFDLDVPLVYHGDVRLKMNLQDMLNQPGVPSFVRDLVGLGGALQVETGGKLRVDIDARLQLGLGFDLTNVFDPSFFVYDHTRLTFDAKIQTLAPLTLEASLAVPVIGDVELFVQDGEIDVDMEGSFGLQPTASGRYTVTELARGGGSVLDIVADGYATIEMPLFAPTPDIPLGGSSG
ncbi:MAG: hypothetical protein MK136_16725, partial [Pirellulaceae bacterium]|nr:hypothetical protein [Pirellulaceae bacterium]